MGDRRIGGEPKASRQQRPRSRNGSANRRCDGLCLLCSPARQLRFHFSFSAAPSSPIGSSWWWWKAALRPGRRGLTETRLARLGASALASLENVARLFCLGLGEPSALVNFEEARRLRPAAEHLRLGGGPPPACSRLVWPKRPLVRLAAAAAARGRELVRKVYK